MIITYKNSDEFYEGVYQLVKNGLTFRGDHSNLTIELLGGY